MIRRRLLSMFGLEDEDMVQTRTIVDYTIEEESNVIQVALSKEEVNAICEAKEIHVAIDMKKPESAESAGTLTFGLYSTAGYYPLYFVSKASNAVPTSSYTGKAIFSYIKNYVIATTFFGMKYYPTSQYAAKNVLILSDVSECIDKSLILKAETTTVFGKGTRIALVII